MTGVPPPPRRSGGHRPRLRQPRGERRARCSSASPGSPATVTISRPQAIARGAAALVVERPLELGVPQVLVAACARRDGPRGGALLRRPHGRPCRRSASPGPTARRRRRSWSGRCSRPAGGQTGLLGTVKSVIGGVEHEVERTTPGGDRSAADVPGDARRRRPRLRDGGLLARAGAAPRRRDPFRRRDLHQPDPGPPRLPPHDGGLLRGQAAAVRRLPPRRRGDQRRRPATARAWPASCERPITFALERDGRLPGAGRRDRPRRARASRS